MLRKLLDSNELRKLEIIEYLDSKENWVTLKELSEQTGYSENVLKKDISLMKQDYVEGTWETSHKGIYFKLSENDSIDTIYRSFLKNSMAFQLLELLLYENEAQIPELAESLFTSSSTLTRLIKRMNGLLVDTAIQIEINPCRVVGNEGTIRNFYGHYFYECYSPFGVAV
ncbi:helix-turn-helix domain-containing protein [Marinilactibacillus sp. GCM10026970]|uniref:helix-turn-helix domain-containing protein n=1 Tax=Marinilactibacillus sp. GCM10026970 TaxID=3252642 RepID=UPI00361ABA87